MLQVGNLTVSIREDVEKLLRAYERNVVEFAQEAEVSVDQVLEWLTLPRLDPDDIQLIEIRHDYRLFEKLCELWHANVQVVVGVLDSSNIPVA